MSGAANLSPARVWNVMRSRTIVFVSPSGVTVRSCCHCRMLSIVESSRNRRPGSSSAMLSRS
ncbi:Uncharacterised protein [Mycobacterium tuberculosis]|uniref:Uncharacterized protein n=1 Tax=Mycobacterium tuberculosis TaxID=1773 RepID=A0A655JU61_MYCTX|nr:Uncharacterised protein [Mycobacterium tuberculosis]COZ14390.1 Uncharacterised protein [Mycobacterium tuberculosis]